VVSVTGPHGRILDFLGQNTGLSQSFENCPNSGMCATKDLHESNVTPYNPQKSGVCRVTPCR
jgi:hypothetical protein